MDMYAPRLIYVIAPPSNRPCKIGIAQDVRSRVKAIQPGYWEPLMPVYVRRFSRAAQIELIIHQRFHKQRLFGEWFDVEASKMADYIRSLDEDYILSSKLCVAELVKVMQQRME